MGLRSDVQTISFAIYKSFDEVVTPYLYEEHLVGWPEQKVLGYRTRALCRYSSYFPFFQEPISRHDRFGRR